MGRMKSFDLKFVDEIPQNDITSDLLYSWHELLKDYELRWAGEERLDFPPHFYNEMPQVGLFALAAYNIGALPFIDFSAKRSHSKPKSNDLSNGRQDLELTFEEDIWNIETKYLKINRGSLDPEAVNNGLGLAKKDVYSLKGKGGKKLAILYVRPYGYSGGTEHHDFIDDYWRIRDSKEVRYKFIAYHLTDKKWLSGKAINSPGIMLVGWYVKPRN